MLTSLQMRFTLVFVFFIFPGLNPACSIGMEGSTNDETRLSRRCSNNLYDVQSNDVGQQLEGLSGSFPGLGMAITLASLHIEGMVPD